MTNQKKKWEKELYFLCGDPTNDYYVLKQFISTLLSETAKKSYIKGALNQAKLDADEIHKVKKDL